MPIPSDPLKRKPFELTTKDGARITLRAPGLEGPEAVEGTKQEKLAGTQPEGDGDAPTRDDGSTSGA